MQEIDLTPLAIHHLELPIIIMQNKP